MPRGNWLRTSSLNSPQPNLKSPPILQPHLHPPREATQQTNMAVMKSTIVLMALSSLFLSALLPMTHATVAFYVFGDSMYDDGMTLYNGVKGAGAQHWPYGETYFKKPAGRYSDGRLIPDFIASYAGLPFPQPYLLPGLNTFTNGVNFASAGACVLAYLRPSTINVKMQVDYFQQMVQKMRQQLGQAEATRVLNEAVYLFNIGGNDYVELVKRNINKPISASYKTAYMNKVLDNLVAQIRTIYNEGGRKFAFQNIGPLGCMPSVKFMLNYKGTCAQMPLDLARMHNAGFLNRVKQLQSQLPGFKYSVYDFYTSLYNRVVSGSAYGFQNSQTACCGSGQWNGDFTCQKQGEKFSVCSNPSEYLWFDAGHPTEKADQQFAQEFWTGNANIVAPYNLKFFFSTN